MGVSAHSRGWHKRKFWRVREGALTRGGSQDTSVPKCQEASVSASGGLSSISDMSIVKDAHLVQVDNINYKAHLNSVVQEDNLYIYIYMYLS